MPSPFCPLFYVSGTCRARRQARALACDKVWGCHPVIPFSARSCGFYSLAALSIACLDSLLFFPPALVSALLLAGIRMCHNLLLNYRLYEKMDVFVKLPHLIFLLSSPLLLALDPLPIPPRQPSFCKKILWQTDNSCRRVQTRTRTPCLPLLSMQQSSPGSFP